jgi:ATP adenylyltransferase
MDHLWTPWRMAYLKGNNPHGDECLFCRKIHGGDDAVEHVVYRGQRVYVTLNLYPYNNGHLMIVPYQHTATLEELDQATVAELMTVTQQAIRVLKLAYNPQAFNIGINQGQAAGAGVADHLHQHVVPRWAGDTNYLTVVGHTRTIPEWIDDTYRLLRRLWDDPQAQVTSGMEE